jgi:hypothetical protein
MSWQRLFNFQAGTKIASGQVNGELNQLINALNSLETSDNNIKAAAQMKKITTDVGGVNIVASTGTDNIYIMIENAGVGVNTFYAAAGSNGLPTDQSIRGISHITSAGFGWILAVEPNNQLWSKYINNGVWSSWNPVSFLTSAVFVAKASSQSITHGTTTKVILDSELRDTLSEFASSSFVPKYSGDYLIISKTVWSAAPTGDVYHDMWEDGIQITHTGAGFGDKICDDTKVLRLTAGKAYEFYTQVFNSNNASTLSAANLYFYRIG